MIDLGTMIDDEHTPLPAIGEHLDRLDAGARWREVAKMGRARQRVLYEKAATGTPIDLGHFVGEAAAREPVIHDGINTLPLPPRLRRFQKRFCRPAEAGATTRLFGYNEGPTRKLVGPGYFVAVPTAGRPQWVGRGAIVIDYFQIPNGPVAAGWPPIVPNQSGLSRFVYHQTRDFMRRVSRHVSIGAAWKRERPLDHYFMLCRQE